MLLGGYCRRVLANHGQQINRARKKMYPQQMQLLWRQRKNRKTIRGEIKEKSKREKKKEKQYARGYVRYPARMKIRVDKWEKASLTMIYKQTGSSARERYRLIQKKETTILPNRLPSCCSMPITSSHRCTTRQMARQRWRYCHDLRTGAWAMISEIGRAHV